MNYKYPFPSALKQEYEKEGINLQHISDETEFELDKYIEMLKGPIVEIGGPSDDGYYFIDGLDLPTRPIISNIQEDGHSIDTSSPDAIKQRQLVDLEIDGTNMPFDNESVGVIMMSHMSHTDDSYLNLSQHEQEELLPITADNTDRAIQEMARIANNSLNPTEVQFSQRTQIYLESFRVLKQGGLLIADGESIDMEVLEHIGFELVKKLQHLGWRDGDPHTGYDFVVRKPV